MMAANTVTVDTVNAVNSFSAAAGGPGADTNSQNQNQQNDQNQKQQQHQQQVPAPVDDAWFNSDPFTLQQGRYRVKNAPDAPLQPSEDDEGEDLEGEEAALLGYNDGIGNGIGNGYNGDGSTLGPEMRRSSLLEDMYTPAGIQRRISGLSFEIPVALGYVVLAGYVI